MSRRRVKPDFTEREAEALLAVIRAGEDEFCDAAEGWNVAAFVRGKAKLLRALYEES